jgi:hypothetical protein
VYARPHTIGADVIGAQRVDRHQQNARWTFRRGCTANASTAQSATRIACRSAWMSPRFDRDAQWISN